jgi:hypothetical protein
VQQQKALQAVCSLCSNTQPAQQCITVLGAVAVVAVGPVVAGTADVVQQLLGVKQLREWALQDVQGMRRVQGRVRCSRIMTYWSLFLKQYFDILYKFQEAQGKSNIQPACAAKQVARG